MKVKAVRKKRRCAFTGCTQRVPKVYVSCREHEALLPAELRHGLLTSFGRPERRDIYQRAERYLAIRSRLSTLIVDGGP